MLTFKKRAVYVDTSSLTTKNEKVNIFSQIHIMKYSKINNIVPQREDIKMCHYMMDIDSNTVDTSPEYQRDVVWTNRHKNSLLADLMGLNEMKVSPDISVIKLNNRKGTMRVIDGKQRTTTCYEFYKNKLPFKYENKFYFYTKVPDNYKYIDSDVLPNEIKLRFDNKKFVVFEYTNLTDEQEKYVFMTTNLGQPLKAIESLKSTTSPMATYMEKHVNARLVPIVKKYNISSHRQNHKSLIIKIYYLAFCKYKMYGPDSYNVPDRENLYNFLKNSPVPKDDSVIKELELFFKDMDTHLKTYTNTKISQEIMFDLLLIYDKCKNSLKHKQTILKSVMEFIKTAKTQDDTTKLTSLQNQWKIKASGNRISPKNLTDRHNVLCKYIRKHLDTTASELDSLKDIYIENNNEKRTVEESVNNEDTQSNKKQKT